MSAERITAISPPPISAAIFGMDEDGGGSEGGKDVSLDDLFSDESRCPPSADEAELGMEKITLSEAEETEVEVKKRHAVFYPPLEIRRTPREKSTVRAATSRTGRGARNVLRPVRRESLTVEGQESAPRACLLSTTSI